MYQTAITDVKLTKEMPSKTGVLKQAERRSDSSYALGVTSKKKEYI